MGAFCHLPDKTIAGSGNGLDESWMARVVAKNFPNLCQTLLESIVGDRCSLP